MEKRVRATVSRAAHADLFGAGLCLAPVARALALMLATGGLATGAQAQQAFSAAWFSAKGAAQNTAAATGRLPDGRPASLLTDPAGYQVRANEQVQRSIRNLNQAAQSIAAHQAAQAAARLAARNGQSPIPDGLAEGGLQVDTNSLTAGWLHAKAPVQSSGGGKTTVTIEQTAEKAILNWETFHVGRDTTVNFDQRAGTNTADGSNHWIALNRVNDPSGRPSQIAGRIQADGAVYIVNRNGIVFTGSSQVDTRSLVASSLRLTDAQFNKGINSPSYYPGQAGTDYAIPTFGDYGETYLPLFGPERYTPGAAPGAVEVQAGARLDVDAGGKLMLFAPKVRNAGHLSAPEGQIIMAAGENVFLKTAENQTSLSGPPEVRGLDVAVAAPAPKHFSYHQIREGVYGLGSGAAAAGEVIAIMDARAAEIGYEAVNTGVAESARGNITMQSMNVEQRGVLSATTALNNRNGSILLRAWGQGTHAFADSVKQLRNWSSGTLTLAPGSVTVVMPDAADTEEIETSALATRYAPGSVRLYGKLVDVQSQATVRVPAGIIDLQSAASAFTIQESDLPGTAPDGSRIYLDRDAFLSVAGLQEVEVAMSRNFIEAELRINELRDSPLLRDSWLRGKKIVIDRRAAGVYGDGPMAGVQWVPDGQGGYVPGAWVGTPLGDVTGWVGVGKTDLAEISTGGGSISLVTEGGDVIMRPGSLLDISGGSVRYTGGMNNATKLLGIDGRIYPVAQASPDMIYVGIAGRYELRHDRWGVSQTWKSAVMGADHYEPGYLEGRTAGAIQVNAGAAIVMEGDIWAGVQRGERDPQRPAQPGGTLTVGGGAFTDTTWSPGHIIVTPTPLQLGADFRADTAIPDDWYVAQRPLSEASDGTSFEKHTYLADGMLNRSGLGTINLYATDDSAIVRDAVLDLFPGTRFNFLAVENAGIDIAVQGSIHAPGGVIQLEPQGGDVLLGAASRLDAGGSWVNGWHDGQAGYPWAIDAGRIAILQTNPGEGRLIAETGATLDVTGGARAHRNGSGRPALQFGDGGSILLGGIDTASGLAGLELNGLAPGAGASLRLDVAADVQLGGVSVDGGIVLPPSLYADRGFGELILNAGGHRVFVPEGVSIVQETYSIDLSGIAAAQVPTGADTAQTGRTGRLRPEQGMAWRVPRLAVEAGEISVGAGAVLRTDAGGRMAFLARGGNGLVDLRGTLEAPAGAIDIDASRIVLDEGAQLLARGVDATYENAQGVRTGRVLAGGSVVLAAGSLHLRAGSLIDVSGTSGRIDGVPGAGGTAFAARPVVTLASDGGAISIHGSGVVEGRLRGHAGGVGAAGARLDVAFAPPLVDPNGSPAEQVQQTLMSMDPDCYGIAGDGVCGTGDWKEALGVDWQPFFRDFWGIPVETPVILPVELITMASGGNRFIVSDSAPGSTEPKLPRDPAEFGLTPEVLDLFRDYMIYTDALREIFQEPTQDYAMVFRPGAMADGGFADLALGGGATPIRLDGVSLSLGRSISFDGQIVQHGQAASRLAAPVITLAGARADGAPLRAGDVALAGKLVVDAGVLEVHGNIAESGWGGRIGGFQQTQMRADHLRLGRLAGESVTLGVDGELVIEAGQVYPAMAAKASIRAGDLLRVEPLGQVAPPLSAGGSLTLQAPVIEQFGVLRAPHGQIVLEASERLVLGAGSSTSVSGEGVIVPYGVLRNNEHWRDPAQVVIDESDPTQGLLTAPPEKRIELKAPDVAMADGAVVDIAGGGDLYAWEFVPGPGGSHDILTQPGMYAILPGYQGPALGAGAAAGDRVWLAGGDGLAAGWYTLLPARYALLPGAFAVQATSRSWTGIAAESVAAADGSLVMPGWRGSAYGGTQDAQASAWRVLSGQTVRRYTEYNEAMANDFFSSDAFKLTRYRLTGQDIVTPRLPRDGGAAVFSAGQALTLDGELRSRAAVGGRGGLVDITGDKIAIVGAGLDASDLIGQGFLMIDAQDLSGFEAGSVLIGGTRRGDPLGLAVDVTASNIVVRNDAGSALEAPEIILAASDLLRIDAGSVIEASGGPAPASDLIVAPQQAAQYNDNGTPGDPADDTLLAPERDWGTLIRVASGDAARVVRRGVDTSLGGQVSIGEQARLQASGALLIDATRTTDMAGSAMLGARSLSVSSGRIGFGGSGEGLLLEAGALTQLSRTEELTLRSYSSFDFHQSVNLEAAGLRAVVLDGGALAGYGDVDVVVRGNRVTLANSGGVTDPVGAGAASLTLAADTIVLGAGEKRASGFDRVSLVAADRIVGQGQGVLDAGAADLALDAPVLTGSGAANLVLRTRGRLDVLSAAAAAPGTEASQDSLGSRLALSGGSVRVGGRIEALGGTVSITATAGDVTLVDGGVVDVGGFAKQFFDLSEYADAGRVELAAVDGSVRVEAGSTLNLSAQPGGGSAGTLALTAGNGGSVLLAGDVGAHAGEDGQAGSLSLDIDALPDFGAFNARLNEAGFLQARDFRIRNGDVTVDGHTRVEQFTLSADRGRIDVVGTVDARAGYGGVIRIIGGGGVALRDGAELLAGATEAIGSGRVALVAVDGTADLAGGLIDVAGGQGGRVLVRARRHADNLDLAVDRLATRVIGARSAVVEGTRSYDSASVGAVRQRVVDEALAFASNRDAMAARLGGAGGWTVAAGVEIVADGDLALDTDWNLYEDFAAARGGSLTLRAGGNLVIGGHLSDGFDRAGRDGALQDTDAWNLSLVAGADLSAADTLALRPQALIAADSGSVIVGTADTDPGEGDNGAGKLVRTGTGDLTVRAGRDIRLAHRQSVIYTAGRRDPSTWDDFTTARAGAVYGIEGGNLDIAARGSVSAEPSGQRFVQWLNRQGAVNAEYYFGDYLGGEYGELPDGSYGPIRRPAEQSSWWIDYGMFEQGVGALGGGNVSVDAGGDLANLVVALPTNMRMRGGRTATEEKIMETRNGGSFAIEAGGAIVGGQYYVARGEGRIRAGETGVGNAVTVTIGDWGGDRSYAFALAPVLAVGDATLSVRTQGDMAVQSVIDPLMVRYGSDGSGDLPSIVRGAYMSGYTDRTALQLVSVGGNIALVNQADYAFRDVRLESYTTDQDNLIGLGGNLYPAHLKAIAMNGGIAIQGPLYVLPSRDTNDVTVAAQADLRFGRPDAARYARDGMRLQLAEPGLYMPYATAAMVPSPAMPVGFGEHSISSMAILLRNEIGTASVPIGSAYFSSAANPAVLPLMDDHEPSRLYAGGSIDGLKLIANEQTWVRAGRDIRGLDLLARNLRPSDVTLLEAGNDILEVGAPRSDYFNHIDIQGPGSLLLSAGRDIYADRLRIVSLGNVGRYDDNNRPLPSSVINGLPAQGAGITAMAGINGEVAYGAFADVYLNPANVAGMPAYLRQAGDDGTLLPVYLTDGAEVRDDGTSKTTRRGLVSYVEAMTGEELAPLAAWERFQTLAQQAQQQFLRQVLLLELRDAGRDQNFPGENGLPRNGGYNRGYAAIERMFPGTGWSGNIAANNLMLRTMAGGDINVLTPGGGLQLAALGATVPAGYGLVTLASGHINVFAHDDVVVNRSRLLSFVPAITREGSDQIVWSTVGDVDAGRGAKTVRIPSSADIVTDTDGNTEIRERSDMSGSGIGTVGDGDVDLVAPVGTVNAGDAGIRVAGNLNIAALHVLNAENIQVKGKATGLPVVAAVNIGALTAASAAASQAAAAAQDVLQQERKATRNSLPSVFTVRVLGFGSEPAPAGGRQEGAMTDLPSAGGQGGDPASYVQMVGAGRHFDARQLARLTPAERNLLAKER
ncbi:filamentous hemagglutinin family protein [Pigmentiphaga sp.]|uniref:filamentous hemagglutinin family protein n=1 Tax=Pigmentiphaga sp. TaxID=1977564 RepID=UPI0025EF3301|nr:filamentous hemagglutinin family protein [Pigmentiphaga sp.]